MGGLAERAGVGVEQPGLREEHIRLLTELARRAPVGAPVKVAPLSVPEHADRLGVAAQLAAAGRARVHGGVLVLGDLPLLVGVVRLPGLGLASLVPLTWFSTSSPLDMPSRPEPDRPVISLSLGRVLPDLPLAEKEGMGPSMTAQPISMSATMLLPVVSWLAASMSLSCSSSSPTMS